LNEISRVRVFHIKDPSDLDDIDISDYDVVVDGLLGTGVRGKIREPVSSAIDLINSFGGDVVAVDVPSGLNPDGGVCDKSVRATITVTLHAPKPIFYEPEGERAGKVVVAGIGVPPDFERLIGPGDLTTLKKRVRKHKGDGGKVLVVGGGPYTGAPALVGLSALSCGVDVVSVAVPSSVSDVVASFSPNLIVHPLDGEILKTEHVDEVIELAKRHHVVVIGNGLGDNDETVEAVRQIIESVKRCVVDADGLRAVELEEVEGEFVLTPHFGELLRILSVTESDTLDRRIELTKKVANSTGCVVLTKGKVDVVSDGENERFNLTGNVGMTVGGTGDVLAGIVGAFLVRDEPMKVACASAFVCGLAGDMAFERKGISLLATDVIGYIPDIIKKWNS
jgi:NAD(P)H-hydrate epimerase